MSLTHFNSIDFKYHYIDSKENYWRLYGSQSFLF